MIRKRLQLASISVLALLFFLAACMPASPAPSKVPDTGALYTQAAQTVSVQLTLGAGQTAVAQLTQIAAAPTQQPAPPTNAPPADTPMPLPPTPTPTPIPPQESPTPTPRPCDFAEFVADVTVKDGAITKVDTPFTKTWRLKNIGTCTWTEEYDLVFVSGDQMDGDKSVPLEDTVRPGETVDVSVDLVAPEDPGEYLGRWQLPVQTVCIGFRRAHRASGAARVGVLLARARF